MKKKLVSVLLALAMSLSCASVLSVSADSSQQGEPDVLRSLFGGIDDLSPDEKASELPYADGTMLTEVREPLYMSNEDSQIFGNESFATDSPSWQSATNFSMPTGTVTIQGKSYTLDREFMLTGAAEGNFDRGGIKDELAVLSAVKTTDGRSLLLLCTVSSNRNVSLLSPIAVLYDGTADFYDNLRDFSNCMEIVCGDINGDGFDEIITATPTSGYTESSGDRYGLDRCGGYYIWSLQSDTTDAWADSNGWNAVPDSVYVGMNTTYGSNCHVGAPGTTASLAVADIDNDGYDDIISAFSTTKARYNADYSSNLFSVYVVGGAPTVKEMLGNRTALMRFMDGETVNKLYLGISSGDAAGFDVTVADVDGSGKPTIFLSFKETVHRWSAMSGDYMYTPSFYIYSFDMKKSIADFQASLVYHGGIYHHGWMISGGAVDPAGYVKRTDPVDCAPVRLGVLRGDFGLSDGKTGYVSSGTIVADQRLYSFVRYPDGDTYRYEIINSGSYTGDWGQGRADNGNGYADDDCVFYRNGINVTDVKTAYTRFDGEGYEDAAFVTTYTENGYTTYFLTRKQNRYGIDTIAEAAAYAAVAMPDADDDAIYLQYNGHAFFWADPVVIAALASPPYFDSLPSDNYTNSQTTYGKSLTSASGKSESYTVSAGAYISSEIKGGGGGVSAVFESEIEEMSSSSFEAEKSVEVSYSRSYSASGGSDTVVLSTVAYDAYSYTAFYPNEKGSPTSSPFIVYVPRGGSDSVKIASINYEDYVEFSKYAKGALPDLSKVFTHTVGKPETYLHTTPSGTNVVNESILTHTDLAGFPSDESSQTLSIEITNETSQTTSSGSSVSVKLGGGVEAEAEDIFGMVDFGSKITAGGVTEKEYESGKIKTKAVGTSFEGTVFGQGDGMNVSGGKDEKAYFNWRLLHYIYRYNDGNAEKQFPVVTYITSGVTQPAGVIPTALSVSPAAMSVEQVGPKTTGYVNEIGFVASIEGVTREAYTALEGASLGMTLNTGDGNIGVSGSYPFGIRINSNVKPGAYTLRLNVGGVLSNPFTVTVTEYTDPIWIKADSETLDFGSMRYNYAKGTPTTDAQTVTIRNIHTETIQNLTASLDENSDFEITEALSSPLLYAKGLDNSSATVAVAPKKGLDIGTHTGTLKISNGVTSAFVTLTYTVTEPTAPQSAPTFPLSETQIPNPVRLYVRAPIDDGGGKMLGYLYTIQGHPDYIRDGVQIWKNHFSYAQSGSEFYLDIPEALTVGEAYTVGVKARTLYGESEAAWHTFRVSEEPNDPAPAENIKIYPGDGCIALTWDPPAHWGENEYYPTVDYKSYNLECRRVGDSSWSMDSLASYDEREYCWYGLENDVPYEITLTTSTQYRGTPYTATVTPSAAAAAKLAPSRPSAFKANMSYKTAELTWKAPIFTDSLGVAYQVSEDGGESWIDVPQSDTDTLSYTFENLTTNQAYDFRVRAVSSAGIGDSALLTAIAPPVLEEPSNWEVFIGNEQVEVIWAPINDESVTGYEVKTDNGEWTAIHPISFDGKLVYIFDNLENDREYALYVRGVNHEGGGNALQLKRAPSALSPLAPVNPQAQPRNGGFSVGAENPDSQNSLRFKVDGDSYWRWLEDNGDFKTEKGYENGTEYTVCIATFGRDSYGRTTRTAVYMTVTPDETIPDPPSAPEISAVIGEKNIRITWNVESDGGSPIRYYEISSYLDTDRDEPVGITLPATESSFTVERPSADSDSTRLTVRVTAYNEIGMSGSEIDVNLLMHLNGQSILSLPSSRTQDSRFAYSLVEHYRYMDDTGNITEESTDVSDFAQWELSTDNTLITWDDETHEIVVDKSLSDGVYTAVLTSSRYGDVYEKEVTVIVGDTVSIHSASVVSDGISVSLTLPSAYGEKLLIAALYDASNTLSGTAMRTVSNLSSDSPVTVAADTSKAAYAKVMLVDRLGNMQPLCEGLTVTVNK